MGFLNWFKNSPDESDSQLDLFGNSQALTPHERVDGAIVNRDFNTALSKHSVSDQGRARAIEAETKELFDCGTSELYRETGGRKGDRASLPKEAQKAYIVNETLSTHRLHEAEIGGNQKQRDEQTIETVKDTAKEVRKWLPW